MTPTDLINDFAKNKRWGRIELVFRSGEVVFYKKEETFVPHTEKNSVNAAPRKEEYGSDYRDFSAHQ